jgi:hypothetical protein
VLSQQRLAGRRCDTARAIYFGHKRRPARVSKTQAAGSVTEQKAIPMWHAFQAGGWAMYFILAFGLSAVYAAARFFWRGEAAFALFSRTMMRSTGLSALFGFLIGMIAVANYIGEHAKTLDDRIVILIEGTGESLNNLTLGLLLITLSTLLVAVGQRRFPTAS